MAAEISPRGFRIKEAILQQRLYNLILAAPHVAPISVVMGRGEVEFLPSCKDVIVDGMGAFLHAGRVTERLFVKGRPWAGLWENRARVTTGEIVGIGEELVKVYMDGHAEISARKVANGTEIHARGKKNYFNDPQRRNPLSPGTYVAIDGQLMPVTNGTVQLQRTHRDGTRARIAISPLALARLADQADRAVQSDQMSRRASLPEDNPLLVHRPRTSTGDRALDADIAKIEAEARDSAAAALLHDQRLFTYSTVEPLDREHPENGARFIYELGHENRGTIAVSLRNADANNPQAGTVPEVERALHGDPNRTIVSVPDGDIAEIVVSDNPDLLVASRAHNLIVSDSIVAANDVVNGRVTGRSNVWMSHLQERLVAEGSEDARTSVTVLKADSNAMVHLAGHVDAQLPVGVQFSLVSDEIKVNNRVMDIQGMFVATEDGIGVPTTQGVGDKEGRLPTEISYPYTFGEGNQSRVVIAPQLGGDREPPQISLSDGVFSITGSTPLIRLSGENVQKVTAGTVNGITSLKRGVALDAESVSGLVGLHGSVHAWIGTLGSPSEKTFIVAFGGENTLNGETLRNDVYEVLRLVDGKFSVMPVGEPKASKARRDYFKAINEPEPSATVQAQTATRKRSVVASPR